MMNFVLKMSRMIQYLIIFVQYKVHAGIHRGSVERRHQTTVGSCVMRTCCGLMLEFICCVCNKLAGSSDMFHR